MLKKIIIFSITFVISFTIFGFLFSDKYFIIPQFEISFNEYKEQKDFQWIEQYQYYIGNKIINLESNYFYTFSVLPVGYVRYKKVGEEIEFFLPDNQLFWKKKSSAYPYFEPYGKYILTINADRTQIDVLDLNGQFLYQFNGLFLVDLKCKEDNFCYLLFNDGRFIIFNQKNKFIFNPEIKNAFYKSLSIDGNQIAVHYYLNQNDYFNIYDVNLNSEKPYLKKINQIQSKIVFPYTVSFLFEKDSILIPHFKETILLSNNKIYKIFKNNSLINEVEIHNQNDISIDVSFLGESIKFNNLSFVLKKNVLEIYDANHNYLFELPIKQDKGSFFVYQNALYIFLENSGYLKFYFIL
ncbi:MAG: hypothetical protein KatS3mg129_0329 [Leptospiraceae bacterium]|nr:MAG: hypothetical protein KatS3mg129_0329 [Leptospiraceae bacterium]